MKKLITLTLLTFCIITIQAQVSTYPYIENFENPSVLQAASSSCDATIDGTVHSGWEQDTLDDGEWRADSAGTTSVGTGPGSNATTSGSGSGTDVNPGSTSGIYLYTEGTSATACTGAEVSLLSPYFDFSTASTYYKMEMFYHMFGTGMGSLHIDVYDGTAWTDDVWTISGNQDTMWHSFELSLANVNSDSARIRIRAIMGSNYQTDLCIDNFSISTFTPPTYDPILIGSEFVDIEYPMIPIRHIDSLTFGATIKNEGVNSTTQTKISISGPSSFSTTIEYDTLQSFEVKTDEAEHKYIDNTVGEKEFFLETSIFETDANTANNYDTIAYDVTDTTMARERGQVNGGLGINAGTAEMGQAFKLLTTDTITTVSFFMQFPTVGDSVKVHFRNFNNSPGSLLTSSDAVIMTAGQNWYTVRLNCPQILSAGEYFVGVEQLVPASNMGLGYSEEYFTPQKAFFVANGGTGWIAVEDQDFLLSFIIRINMNPNMDIIAATDTTCPGVPIQLEATNGVSFSWSPSFAASDPTKKQTQITLNQSTTVSVTADFGCGLTVTKSIPIYVKPSPSGTISADTTICEKGTAVLSASGGNSYTWASGPSNTNYSVSPDNTTRYNVKIDSNNGCFTLLSTQVSVNHPQVVISGDDTVCENTTTTLTASGTDTYQWTNGPTTATYSPIVSANTSYIVTGFDAIGCEDSDTFYIVTETQPNPAPIADTGACFATSITIAAPTGWNSYQWSTGATTSSIQLNVLGDKEVIVDIYSANGCYISDTIFVERYIPPILTIDNDTTLCEGTTTTISAYGADTYEWSTGAITQTIDISPTEATSYSVTGYSDKGCSDNDEIEIGFSPLPNPAFKVKVFQDSLTFLNQSTSSDTYSWNFGDGSTSSDTSTYHIYDTTGDYTITLTATNGCGSVDSAVTIKVNVPDKGSIGNMAEWAEVNLYPIPTERALQYKLKNNLYGPMQVVVMDAAGRVLKSTDDVKSSTSHTGTVDMSHYSNGVYIIQFTIGSSTISKRVVKK